MNEDENNTELPDRSWNQRTDSADACCRLSTSFHFFAIFSCVPLSAKQCRIFAAVDATVYWRRGTAPTVRRLVLTQYEPASTYLFIGEIKLSADIFGRYIIAHKIHRTVYRDCRQPFNPFTAPRCQ